MNEQVWYVYQNGKQLGPFAVAQVRQMVDSKMIPQDAYLFKVGWKDWRPIEDCLEELGKGTIALVSERDASERRAAAPRATIRGRIIVHNGGQLVIGSGVNVSSSGIFIEFPKQVYALGEKLKLTCRIDRLVKPFNVTAEVIRFNQDPRFPIGYGLRFLDLSSTIGQQLETLIRQENDQKSQNGMK